MDRFLAIDGFVRVAESQSFAQAARQMRVSRSVVAARIQRLEEFVGAPLFHRNTRSVRLSELGQACPRDCCELVGRTNEVVDQRREATTSPVGRLRAHALPGFVLGHLARLLQELQARYPQIVLDLIVNDAAIDPVKEGFDCALQICPPRSEELNRASCSRCDGYSAPRPNTSSALARRATRATWRATASAGAAGLPAEFVLAVGALPRHGAQLAQAQTVSRCADGRLLGLKPGEIYIATGALLFGDREGVLVIPREAEVEAIRRARAKCGTEGAVAIAIQGGMSACEGLAKLGVM
jgi:DNA-binding transcriptional LysR family regulator